jgi:S1-C subfamily serine protease
VVIDDACLLVTIGYLITEAMGAEVMTGSGRVRRADVVGFDVASGIGLLRGAERLAVKPMPIGTAKGLGETPVVVAGAGGPETVRPAVVVSRPNFRRLLGILS